MTARSHSRQAQKQKRKRRLRAIQIAEGKREYRGRKDQPWNGHHKSGKEYDGIWEES